MHDDEDTALPPSLLLTIPETQRTQFRHLREMAALKGIDIYPSSTDDGLVGFRIDREGHPSARCADMPALEAQLVALGLPLLAPQELQQLLRAFQSAFIKSMEGGVGPHGEH
jgi:hypothetical protein